MKKKKKKKNTKNTKKTKKKFAPVMVFLLSAPVVVTT